MRSVPLHTAGDFYLVLVISVSLLERGLFDLYHDSPEAAKDEKPPTILKDLLDTAAIKRSLPECGAQWLRLLFHPRCLNLRNLVWHGFLTPEEVCPGHASLVLLLLLSLPRANPRPMWTPAAFDSFFEADRQPPITFGPHHGSAPGPLVLHLRSVVHQSSFVPPGHQWTLCAAIDAASKGRTALFMILALPALEQALRRVFATVNECHQISQATCGKYYSTLDGYGQKNKHQLLLEPEVREELGGGRNRLLRALPPGIVDACFDLFLLDAGPGLRGKLAHGDIDLLALSIEASGRNDCHSAEEGPLLIRGMPHALDQVLLSLIVALCAELPRVEAHLSTEGGKSLNHPGSRGSTVNSPPGASEPSCSAEAEPRRELDEGTREQAEVAVAACVSYLRGYHTIFHPNVRLLQRMVAVRASLEALEETIERMRHGVSTLEDDCKPGSGTRYFFKVWHRLPEGTEELAVEFEAKQAHLGEACAQMEPFLSALVDQHDERVVRAIAEQQGLEEAHQLGLFTKTGRQSAGHSLRDRLRKLDAVEVVPGVECLRNICEACALSAEALDSHLPCQLAAAETRSLSSTGRRQLAQMLHARRSVALALHLALLSVELQLWEQKPEHVAFCRKLLAFIGNFQVLCEAQRYGEAMDRIGAFISTKASKAYFVDPTGRQHK